MRTELRTGYLPEKKELDVMLEALASFQANILADLSGLTADEAAEGVASELSDRLSQAAFAKAWVQVTLEKLEG